MTATHPHPQHTKDRAPVTYTVQREDAFDFLGDEYAELHAASDATAFQHGRWLHHVYATLAPARGGRPVVVTVRDAVGALMAVLPLVASGRALRRITAADLGVTDYNVAAVRRTARDSLVRNPAVIDGVRRALGRFDVLQIDRVVDSPDRVVELLKGSRSRLHHYEAHLLALPDTRDGWREAIDPKLAHYLDKRIKRMRPKGERRLRLVDDVSEVRPLMLRLREFRAARFANRRAVDLVQDEDFFDFYCKVAEDSIRQGGPCRLLVLEVGGVPAAIAYDLGEPDRDLQLLVGYDSDGPLRHFSLGLLIVDELVYAAIDRGKSYYDLTVGDHAYKTEFRARPRPLYQVRLTPTVRGRAVLAAEHSRLRARQLAKRVVERWQGPRPGTTG